MSVPTVCAIGTTEPWAAAGLGLDVLALAENGVRPAIVVAGVTAQDRSGIRARHALPAELVTAQLDALAEARIAAYRIGALLDEATLDAVVAHLVSARAPVVFDPVVAASGGGDFAGSELRRAFVQRLVPRVDVLTPNLSEAALLAGMPSLDDLESMERAGRALCAAGARAVLVKGGHLAGAACDVLVEAERVTVFESPRLAGSLRGTGCLLACALAASLARGDGLHAAVEAARAFVRGKFATARNAGGMSVAY